MELAEAFPSCDLTALCAAANHTLFDEHCLDLAGTTQVPWYDLPSKFVYSILLVCLSGLFSGLNLGLMSLDKVGLEIVIGSGTPQEVAWARKIYPVRIRGNLLLCTLLIGNVIVNVILPIMMADFTSGLIGGAISTVLIVIFGEIVPQAVCNRHGLFVGAMTLPIVKFFILVLYPFTAPISWILDKVLGEEIGAIYSKAELKKLLGIHASHVGSDLNDYTSTILKGALDFSTKIVADVMTHMGDVFMLPSDLELDFETLERIRDSGHSRIPICNVADKKAFEGGLPGPNSIVGVLVVKDLILVNPQNSLPLSALGDALVTDIPICTPETSVEDLLNVFKKGRHLALVEGFHTEIVDGVETDPMPVFSGIVTLEDLIEEIINDEIVDETDVYIDEHGEQPNVNRKSVSAIGIRPSARSAGYSLTPAQLSGICAQLVAEAPDVFVDALTTGEILRRSKVVRFESGKEVLCKSDVGKRFIFILDGGLAVTIGDDNIETTLTPWRSIGIDHLRGLPTPCCIHAVTDEDNTVLLLIERDLVDEVRSRS